MCDYIDGTNYTGQRKLNRLRYDSPDYPSSILECIACTSPSSIVEDIACTCASSILQYIACTFPGCILED